MYLKANAFFRIGSVEIEYDKYNFEWSYESTDDNSPNYLDIKIPNLSEELKQSIKKGSSCVFSFGYNDSISDLIYGTVDSIQKTLSTVDNFISLKIIETSSAAFSDTSKSYSKGVKSSDIIKDIANEKKLLIKKLVLVKDISHKAGYVAYGKAINIIKKLVEACGSSLLVEGSDLTIYNPKDKIKTEIEVINYNTGLLSEPSEHSEKGKPYDYSIDCIAFNSLRKNSVIKIESDTLKAYAKIIKFSIDNFKAEYIIQVMEV